MRSDNGLPFVAVEFEGFLEYLGMQHRNGISYCPQNNGKVERFNETVMRFVGIAELERKRADWRLSDA